MLIFMKSRAGAILPSMVRCIGRRHHAGTGTITHVIRQFCFSGWTSRHAIMADKDGVGLWVS
jgi:hypothetical protein